MLKDPIETSDGAYVLEYLSKGKRGDKHYVCKIYVSQEKLLVLTAQGKGSRLCRQEARTNGDSGLLSKLQPRRVILEKQMVHVIVSESSEQCT